MTNHLGVLFVVALVWHICSATHECNRTIVGGTMTFTCPAVSSQLLRLYDLTSDQLANITAFVARGAAGTAPGPFTSIPPNLCLMPNLQSVTFANNLITIVDPPNALATCLSSVVTLDLSYNLITTFPSYLIYNMPSLTTLNLQHNNLSEVPWTAFSNVSTLEILDFSYNSLTTLELWTLDVKTKVDLSNNQITTITNKYFYTSDSSRVIEQGVFLTGNGPTINFTDAVYPMYDQCDEVALWYFSLTDDPPRPAFTQKMGRLSFGTTQINCGCDQAYFVGVFQSAAPGLTIEPIFNTICTYSSQNATNIALFNSSCANPTPETNSTVDFTQVYPRLCKIQNSEGGSIIEAPTVSPPTTNASTYPHYETVDMAPGSCFMTFINVTTLSMGCTNDTSTTVSRIPASIFGGTFMSGITRVLFPTTISSLPTYLCGLPSGTIDLSYQAFTALTDATFPCLDSFQTVSLPFNQLTSVSMANGNFKNLSSLDLSSNQLSTIPYSVLNPTPTSLRYLNLRNNSINYIDLFVHTRKNITIDLSNNPINSSNILNPQNTTLTNVTNSTAIVTYPASVTNSTIIVDDSLALTYGECNNFQSLRTSLLTLKSISSQTRLDCSCKSVNLKLLYTNNNMSILDDFTCRDGTSPALFTPLTLAMCPNATNFSSGLCSNVTSTSTTTTTTTTTSSFSNTTTTAPGGNTTTTLASNTTSNTTTTSSPLGGNTTTTLASNTTSTTTTGGSGVNSTTTTSSPLGGNTTTTLASNTTTTTGALGINSTTTTTSPLGGNTTTTLASNTTTTGGLGINSTTTTTSSSGGPGTTTPSTNSTNTTLSPNLQGSAQSDSSSNRTGLIVGLVVGIVGLLLLIAAIIAAVLLIKRCKRSGGSGTQRRVNRDLAGGLSRADGKPQPVAPSDRLKSRNMRPVRLAPLSATPSRLPSAPVSTMMPSNNNTLNSSNINSSLRGSARGIPLRLDPTRSSAGVMPSTTTTLANPPTLHSTSSWSTNPNPSSFAPLQTQPSDASRPLPFRTLNIGGDTRT